MGLFSKDGIKINIFFFLDGYIFKLVYSYSLGQIKLTNTILRDCDLVNILEDIMKESSRWENSKSLIRLVNSLLYTPFATTFTVNFNESQKSLNNLEY